MRFTLAVIAALIAADAHAQCPPNCPCPQTRKASYISVVPVKGWKHFPACQGASQFWMSPQIDLRIGVQPQFFGLQNIERRLDFVIDQQSQQLRLLQLLLFLQQQRRFSIQLLPTVIEIGGSGSFPPPCPFTESQGQAPAWVNAPQGYPQEAPGPVPQFRGIPQQPVPQPLPQPIPQQQYQQGPQPQPLPQPQPQPLPQPQPQPRPLNPIGPQPQQQVYYEDPGTPQPQRYYARTR